VSISQAPLTLSATTDSRAYNANTSSAATPTISGGTLVGGDSWTTFAQTFQSKDVLGTGGSTLIPTYSINDGNGGQNYLVTTANAVGTINPYALSVSGASATSRVYDATTTAVISGSISPINSEIVTLTGGGSFPDPNVGTAKAVASAFTLTGIDAGNYTLTQPTGLTADITARPLTVSFSTASKVYDGNTNAALPAPTFTNIISSDSSRLVLSATGSYDDRNIGTGKVVSFSALTLSGSASGNYSLPATATGTGTITALANLAWTGTTTGVWSNAANWGGVAVDGNNVQSLTWPTGTTVAYDLPGTTVINSINNSGSLVMNSTGALQIGTAAAHTSTVIGLSVQGGTLSGVGTLTSVTPVALSGGTLKGSGFTINASLQHTGGTLAPGASPGSLNITGNYTMGPSAILQAEIGGASAGSQYDVLNVAGAATLDGTLEVLAYGGYSPTVSTGYPGILNALGGISGSFANKSMPSGYTLTAAASQIDVSYTAVTPPATANDTITTSLITSTNLANATSPLASSSSPEPISASGTADTSGSTTTTATATTSGPIVLSGFTAGGNAEQFGSADSTLPGSTSVGTSTASTSSATPAENKGDAKEEKKDEKKEEKAAKVERKETTKAAQKKVSQCS
jgi:hypothetical protein